ncbi:hypothetical protein ACQY0O_001352 [Thecaphora frezii]
MPKDKTEPKKTIRRACDACHHRRVRCNHANPCDNCVRLGIPCSWIKASKGKQASGRRIDLLRKGHNPAAGDLGPDVVAGPSNPSPHHAATAQAGPLPAHYASHSPMGASVSSASRWRDYEERSAPYREPSDADGATPSQWSPLGSRQAAPPGYGQPGHLQQPQQSSLPPQHHLHHHHHNHSPHRDHDQRRFPPQSQPQPQPQPQPPPLASGFAMPLRRSSLTPVAPSFNPSANFNNVLGSSFSDLSPEVAAGIRLPDFGTSLADTYFNSQQQQQQQQPDGGRRNVLMAMQSFGGVNVVNGSDVGNGSTLPLPDGAGVASAANGGQRQTVLDVLGQSSMVNGRPASTPGSTSQSDTSAADALSESHPLSDSVLIPTIALFFERLQSIMPVFTRAWIFSKLDRSEHHFDPQFGSMLIAMSAFALIQPVEASDPVVVHARKRRVRKLLQEAVRMRTSAFFGDNPSLEATMTSFYIFGTLFGLGEENAAWFRLREAVTLGHLLRLHEPAAYEQLDKAEQERRLRAYWLLAITERAYAIQSGHSITFRGNPRAATASIRRKFDDSELEDFPNIQSRLFDVVDEKFVDCWNKRCPGKGCDYLDAERAISLHDAIVSAEEDPDPRPSTSVGSDFGERGGGGRVMAINNGLAGTPPMLIKQEPHGSTSSYSSTSDWHKAKVQKADVDVTRQWLLNRLWLTCLSHGLLTADSEHPCLRIDYAIDIARETLRVCNALSLRSMEAHGIGLTRKLNDIAQTLVVVCREFPAIAMSVPYEGDPINLAPNQFGPHSGPSPSEHYGSPTTLHSTSDSPGHTGTSTTTATTATTTTTTTTTTTPLGSKAFSPSFAIEAILHKYLDLFKRFRGGDHPYLPELVEAVKELPKMAELSFDKFLREMGLF